MILAAVDITIVSTIAIVAAGAAAGFVNAVVGSGTLISFPTLVSIGYVPQAANIANTIGLSPGSLSAAIGFRKELRGQGRRLTILVPASALGAISGAVLLLTLPSTYFKSIVPVLILIGVGLVAAQPRMQARLKVKLAAEAASGATTDGRPREITPLVWFAVFGAGIYGGYFGAAQGVILVGILGFVLSDELVRINALKNALATVVNGVAALLFIIRGDVQWTPALLIAGGSIVGAQLGSTIGRRIPAPVLRGIIIVVGTFAALKMLYEFR